MRRIPLWLRILGLAILLDALQHLDVLVRLLGGHGDLAWVSLTRRSLPANQMMAAMHDMSGSLGQECDVTHCCASSRCPVRLHRLEDVPRAEAVDLVIAAEPVGLAVRAQHILRRLCAGRSAL